MSFFVFFLNLQVPPHHATRGHAHSSSAVSAILVTVLLACVFAVLGYYVFKHKTDAFRFHYFRVWRLALRNTRTHTFEKKNWNVKFEKTLGYLTIDYFHILKYHILDFIFWRKRSQWILWQKETSKTKEEKRRCEDAKTHCKDSLNHGENVIQDQTRV